MPFHDWLLFVSIRAAQENCVVDFVLCEGSEILQKVQKENNILVSYNNDKITGGLGSEYYRLARLLLTDGGTPL